MVNDHHYNNDNTSATVVYEIAAMCPRNCGNVSVWVPTYVGINLWKLWPVRQVVGNVGGTPVPGVWPYERMGMGPINEVLGLVIHWWAGGVPAINM